MNANSFSFSPRRFVFQTEISSNYIVFVLISLLFYFFSSLRRGVVYRFLHSFFWSPKIGTLLHWFVVVVLPILSALYVGIDQV